MSDLTDEELRREQIRKDIARKTQEILYEPRRFVVSVVVAAISLLVAGGIIGGVLVNWLNVHQPAPQPIVIQLPMPK